MGNKNSKAAPSLPTRTLKKAGVKNSAWQSSKKVRVLIRIALRFRQMSSEAFVGDLMIGSVAALLYYAFFGFEMSIHPTVQILRNFYIWFLDSLTKFDYSLFLIAILVSSFMVGIYSEERREKRIVKFVSRPYIRVVADVAAIGLGAELVVCLAEFCKLDFNLIPWPPTTEELGRAGGQTGVFILYAFFFWTCRAILEGYADRYFFKPYYGYRIDFASVLRRAGFSCVSVYSGLVCGIASGSTKLGLLGFVGSALALFLPSLLSTRSSDEGDAPPWIREWRSHLKASWSAGIRRIADVRYLDLELRDVYWNDRRSHVGSR